MNYDTEIKMIGKMEHIWVSVSVKGKKEGAWVKLEDIPLLKNTIQRLTEIETRDNNRQKLLNTLLEARGLSVPKDSDPFYNLYLLMLNSFIIAKDKPMYAVNFDEDGYIKSGLEIQGLLDKENIEDIANLFSGCYKIVDGVLTFDEEKYNSMMGAVL